MIIKPSLRCHQIVIFVFILMLPVAPSSLFVIKIKLIIFILALQLSAPKMLYSFEGRRYPVDCSDYFVTTNLLIFMCKLFKITFNISFAIHRHLMLMGMDEEESSHHGHMLAVHP